MTTTSDQPAGSTLRTLPRRLAGRALTKTLRLPSPTTSYTVSEVKVPMRDGVELVTDVYEPTTEAVGTLLVRGPYGRAFPFSIVFADLHVARGYRVVLQSVRGTFGSGGDFSPMVNEAADGADTVEWMRRQPWWKGRFATIGISYLGFTQWALLQDPPPELAAAVITAGPHDLSLSTWGTGAFSVNDFLNWSHLVAHQEDGNMLVAGVRQLRAQRNITRAAAEAPLGAAGRALLGAGAPWWESWLTPPADDNPFWDPLNVESALDRVQVPTLLLSGWQDLFLPQTLHQFAYLRERGVDVALTMGPWAHSQLLMGGLTMVARETQEWLDNHLAGRPATPRTGRFRFHVGHEGWRELADWPPATTARELYLQPGGGLADTAPAAGSSASFRYDPAHPTPTIGGRLLSPDGGYRDDTALAARRDVLSFTSDPLPADLVVHGCPVADLAHSSDHPFVDVFVRVSEVDAKGRSRNVSDGYRRLSQAGDQVRLELDAISHRFRAETRIRVLIAGGSHPRFDRNLGNGEPTLTGSQLTPSTHEVHFGASRIVLPVES
ncbi:CocE/NonD family hydrolase [Candidatus Mycobacterium wuenschmannii]|uniref:CocE/NonD family hydrolase n=1 Tax=Candidatus Mycobacterium wuenschmannii TaxID=3027808 RepID=A0ABY8W042_9MYCO|nr:CocE/NonD family hydrolase [Candidatus Mycobacterium wuenschmannii]WIM88332.1 CocE/NonD family hydrolase [Candidatus Mycobacterium wuenschmannii]